MLDFIIIAVIVVGIVLAVRKRSAGQKSQAPKAAPVIDTVGTSTPKGGSSAPAGGASASAGFGDDDGSEFRFSSDDDFAAALGALTGEAPPAAAPAPVAIVDEDEPQGVSGGSGNAAPGFTGSGVVRCKINGEYDREGTSARFENGKIYGLSSQGEYLIGSYNEELTEVRNTRDEIIGRIDGNLIILSREGQVARLKAQGREKTPDELVLLCAERKGDRICSTENGEEMALCGSDDPASAAAFICLHYDGDGIGPKESELHRFWYSWM